MSLVRVEIEQKVRTPIAPDGMAKVIHSRNPFDTTKHKHCFIDVGDGLFVGDAIPYDLRGVPEELVVASVNGSIIPIKEYNTTKVSEGDVVIVFEVPGGGDDAKAIFRLVAFIALVVLSGGLANAGLFGSGFSAGVYEVAFIVAGAVLINAILPPVAPGSINSETLSDSRTYGIDGAKNTSDEGAPLPVCYGPFRMAGNIINFHTRNIANDQYLYLLLNAGEGISAGLTDIELNEQPIAGFLNAETQLRLGDDQLSVIDWFEDTISPTAVGVSVTTAFQTRTTGLIDRFRLDFVCPNGLVEYKDDGSRVARTITFAIEYKKVSEPTVWTTLFNLGNVTGQTVEYDYFGFDNYFLDGTIDFTTHGDFGRTSFRDGGDFVTDSVIFSGSGRVVGQQNDRQLHTAAPDIRLNQTSAVRFSFYSLPLAQDTYDIRVRRLIAKSTDEKIRDGVTWTDLNEIVEDDVAYKHTALVALKIRLTDQLSSLPTVTYMNQGRVIRFWDTTAQAWDSGPSTNPAWIVQDMFSNTRFGGGMALSRMDYDAWIEWGEYCDNEGLTFQGVFDTNSNLWDAAMHVFRAGHARPLKMGTKYSVAIDRAIEPTQMFTVGNIMKDTFQQKWMPLNDRANEVELHYFDETDRFKRRTIKVYDDIILSDAPRNTATATMYGIVDKTRAAEEATYMLLNNRYLKSTVSFKVAMEAVAVTVGDVFLLQHDQPDWASGGRMNSGSTTTNLLTDRNYTFDIAKSYKALVRYDSLIKVSPTIVAITVGTPGRRIQLSGAYTGQTDIDRIVKSGGPDLRITRMESDAIWVEDSTGLAVSDSVDLVQTDAIEVRDVVAATSGTQTTIPLVPGVPLPQAPDEFSVYMVGEALLVENEWRVTKIVVDKNLDATISGATYDERIYNWTPLTSQPVPDTGQSRVVPHVINLDAQEANINIGGILRPVLDISWDLPPDFENYGGVLIETNVDGGGYRFVKEQRGGMNATVEHGHNDSLDVRVIAMSTDGRYALNSSAPEVLAITFAGDTFAPATPTSFAITAGALGIHLSWVNPTDVDFAGLEIKRNTVDDEGAATSIYTTEKAQVNWDDILATTVAVNYFYWARSIDFTGNLSAWVASTPTNATPNESGAGIDATTAFLTNEAHGVPADTDGGNPVFSGASGEFKVFKGITDITAATTFSVFAADNLTGTINTTVNEFATGPIGFYQVTAETSAQDIHSFVLRAVTTDSITIDRTFSLTKNKAGADGAGGDAGLNSATASLYNKNTSSVTPPSAFSGTFTYTFATSVLSGGTPNGWTQDPPDIAAGEFLWVRQAVAVSNTATDTIPTSEFSGAVVVSGTGVDGTDGGDGFNSATVDLFNKNADSGTPPSAFSGTFTYTFSTAVLSGGTLNGWTQDAPDIAEGEFLWVRKAAAVSITATDSVPTGDFSSAVVISGTGATASTVVLSAEANAFLYENGVLVGPADIVFTVNEQNTTGSTVWLAFDHSGAAITPISNILSSISDSSATMLETDFDNITNNTFIKIRATREGISDEITIFRLVGAQGNDGLDGFNTATLTAYKRADVVPTDDPGASITYTFATAAWTPGNGWSKTIPAGNDPLYALSATAFSNQATDNVLSADWSAPTLILRDGLTSVPDFNPGLIGGTSDFRWILNQVVGGTPNDGEIRVIGNTFDHPDGTIITTQVLDFAIHTTYEAAFVGRFYIMFSAVNAETRFGGIVNDWGDGSDTRFCVVTHDDTNNWRARNNSGTYFAFTPIATDCIMAICDKVTGSGGIETIALMTGGRGGINASVNYAGAYATFETSPIIGSSSGNVTPTMDSVNPHQGSIALKSVASGIDGFMYLGANTVDYNIDMPPNQNWILSAYIRLDNVNNPVLTTNANMYVKTSDGLFHLVLVTVVANGQYARYEGKLDLTSNNSTTAMLRVDNDSFNAQGDTTMYFDNIQLELDDGRGLAREFVVPALGGANSIVGNIEPSNGAAWTRAPNAGAWTPSVLTTDLDVTFEQAGEVVARIARRITLTSGTGNLLSTVVGHIAGDLNTSRVSVGVGGSNSTAIAMQFSYSFDGEQGIAFQTVTSSQGGDDGAQGDVGLNSATASLYNKNTSDVTPPAAFSGTFTYTFATNVLSGGTPNGWTQDPPTLAQGEFLWLRQGVAVSNTATDTIPTSEFSGAIVAGGSGDDGATGGQGGQGNPGNDGADGFNSATVDLFNKNTSAVTPPSAFSGTFTYTFSTAVLSGGTLNGWTQDAPDVAQGEFLWVRKAAAVSISATDSVPTGDFSAAVVVGASGTDGADGATGGQGGQGNPGDDGLNVATAFIYQRTGLAGAPAVPSGTATYTFATGAITGLNNGWTDSIPAISGGDFLWVSLATASSIGVNDTIATGEWQAPEQLSATRGGAPGYSTSYKYDDLDTSGQAAGNGRYAMLTARLTSTSGDQDNFQNTDGILLNIDDTLALNELDGYYGTLRIGDRITYWINSGRWYLYEIDAILAFVGSGAGKAHRWGVTLVDFVEDSNSAITTAAGFDVKFQFNKAVTGNFVDVKFKRSDVVPALATGNNPSGWTDEIPTTPANQAIYQIRGTKTFDNVLLGSWSAPSRIQGLIFRGSYAAGTAYLPDDVVAFSERTFICILASTGNSPPVNNSSNTWWDLLAGKGDTGDPPTPFVETIVVSGGGPVNLRNLADNHTPAYDGIADATVTFTIANGQTITGNANGGRGLDTGVWPSGSATIALTLENDGIIRGGGGRGGAGSNGGPGGGNGGSGGSGGDAIYCQEDITIDNAPAGPGLIQASGGGGGGGGGAWYPATEPISHGGGGGGGAFPNGSGGAGGSAQQSGANGTAGTTSAGQPGGNGGGNAGNGGKGGNVDVNGLSGTSGTGSHQNGSGGGQGIRGFAVRKNGHTVGVTGGTVTGQQG